MTFPVAYRIPAELEVRHWGCGTRRPQLKAHHQARRTRNEWVCFFSIQGSVSVIDEYNDQEYHHEIPTGIIHIIPPGMWQRSAPDFPVGSEFLWWHFCTDEQWDYCSQAQALDLIDEQLQHGQQDQWLIPSHGDVNAQIDEFKLLHKQLCDVSHQWGSRTAAADTICRYLLLRLHQACVAQLTSHDNQNIPSNDERHIRQAQVLIMEQYQSIDSLQQVADELGLNAAYLARCCKRVLNCSIGDLIVEQRIRVAKFFLQYEQMSLKEIASACGFSSLNYFCRRFKQQTGLSPGLWRRKYQ